MKHLALLIVLAFVGACSTQDETQPQAQPTLVGSWRYVSNVISSCDDPSDELNEQCSSTASACGILTLTENTWTWSQTLPDGSHFAEAGSYTLSGNYFLLSGAAVPGTKMYSVSGSIIAYTTTTLLFVNSSEATGCTYTVTYARHAHTSGPLG